MKKARTVREKDEIPPEIDFSGGVRGKYAARYAQETNVIVLEPDVAKLFPNAKAVNTALRSLASAAQAMRSPAKKAG